MPSQFVFVSDVDANETATNPMSGLSNRVGRLYLLGNEPQGKSAIRQQCCPLQARRFKLGMSIDEFNVQLRKLKYGQIEFF